MKTLDAMRTLIDTCDIETLKNIAIEYKDDCSNEGFLIGDYVNNKLIENLPDGEFAKFAEQL